MNPGHDVCAVDAGEAHASNRVGQSVVRTEPKFDVCFRTIRESEGIVDIDDFFTDRLFLSGLYVRNLRRSGIRRVSEGTDHRQEEESCFHVLVIFGLLVCG